MLSLKIKIKSNVKYIDNIASYEIVQKANIEAVKQAENVIGNMKEEYELGTRPLLDLLNAKQDLFIAQNQLNQANNRVTTEKLRLLHAIGQIN